MKTILKDILTFTTIVVLGLLLIYGLEAFIRWGKPTPIWEWSEYGRATYLMLAVVPPFGFYKIITFKQYL